MKSLAVLVAAASRYMTLSDRAEWAEWLQDMKDDTRAKEWVAQHVPEEDRSLGTILNSPGYAQWKRRGSRRASAMSVIRRHSPLCRQWYERVKYKPGNSGYKQAHESFLAASCALLEQKRRRSNT